jgi:hypothetical protein
VGFNYLGVASFWAQDFETAENVLQAAVWFAEASPDPTTSFHPLVNQCFSEMLRVFHLEREQRASADVSKLLQLTSLGRKMTESGQLANLDYGPPEIGLVLFDFANCFAFARAGDLDSASEHFLNSVARVNRLPAASWLHAIVWWARLELALAHGDVCQGLVAAHAMGRAAFVGEHVPLARIARSLQEDLREVLNAGE